MTQPGSKPSDKPKLPLRVDKTLEWLETSRDSWKEKTKATKDELKKKKLAVKRTRAIRDALETQLAEEKAGHQKSLDELAQRDREIAELKAKLAQSAQQLEESKKKR